MMESQTSDHDIRRLYLRNAPLVDGDEIWEALRGRPEFQTAMVAALAECSLPGAGAPDEAKPQDAQLGWPPAQEAPRVKPALLSETGTSAKHRQEEGESAAPSPVPGGGSPPASRPSGKHRRLFRYLLVALATVVVLGGAAEGVYALRHQLSANTASLSVTLKAQSTAVQAVTPATMEQCVQILKDRLQRLALPSFGVTRQGRTELVLTLPKGTDVNRVLAVVQPRGLLEFYDLGTQFGAGYTSQAQALKAAGVIASSQLPKGEEVIHWPVSAGSPTDSWYLATTPPSITGSALAGAQLGFDQFNNAIVALQFTSAGATAFADLTGKMAQRTLGHRRGPATGDCSRRDGRICSIGEGASIRRPGGDNQQVHGRRSEDRCPLASDGGVAAGYSVCHVTRHRSSEETIT